MYNLWQYINVYSTSYIGIYRVIYKSLRDFRPLRYSSQDGHAKGERVNRGRDTPSFCPTLQVGNPGGTYELPCIYLWIDDDNDNIIIIITYSLA